MNALLTALAAAQAEAAEVTAEAAEVVQPAQEAVDYTTFMQVFPLTVLVLIGTAVSISLQDSYGVPL